MPTAPSELRRGPITTDSRSITLADLRMIARMTGGKVTSSDHDFFDIPYLEYGIEGYGRGCRIRFGEKDPQYSLPRPDYRYTNLTPLHQEERFTTGISLYGYPTIHWHNPTIEVTEGSTSFVNHPFSS